MAYVRTNALKGRRFKSLSEENLFLSHWEDSVADKRIHGTTRKQVAACFEEERPHLQPLPASLFPCFQEGQRSVHRDSYVEVQKAFYEAPPELIGREVWVRWDSRCVKIFNERMELRFDPSGEVTIVAGTCPNASRICRSVTAIMSVLPPGGRWYSILALG